jgi:hypothetical protein
MSALDRENVNARATYLVNDNIGYGIGQQIVVTTGLTTGHKIVAGDILTMRCDGVVVLLAIGSAVVFLKFVHHFIYYHPLGEVPEEEAKAFYRDDD